jgi:ribosomal protein L11 methyltransferase
MHRNRTDAAKPPTYAKMTFRLAAALADEAAGLLVANGALGCAVAGIARPGARARTIVTLEAYFARAQAADVARIGRVMRTAGMIDQRARGRLATVVDPGWATMWQRRFAPFRIGHRILIVPPWNRRREPGRISVAIKPGQAFGTGHHPSTAGALRALETALSSDRAAHRTALDVGTGSGVLAIAMRMMGVARVVAIDVDEVALDNARDNAELNGCQRAIRFSAIPLRSVRGRFDLVAANILSAVLIDMAQELSRRLAPGGQMILGGILASEAAAVTRRFRKWLRLVDMKRSRGWATLVFAR